jgi:uncharacterized protein YndB with AHSA1/START domain
MAEVMTELRLERTFQAERERVFDAWVNEEVLRLWWAAQPDWECSGAAVDPRVGGRYELSMREPDSGTEHTVAGEYREFERPSRLVYTWAWQGDDAASNADADDTLVTVEFHDEGDEATRVVLTHTGFASEESRANHEHGWNGCFDNLERRGIA